MTFSEKLQRLRKVNGLSQEQLAEKLNVSRQAISKWEMGAIPDMDNVIKISRFFDCSLDYLMNNEAEETSIKPFPSQAAPQKTAKKKKSFSYNCSRNYIWTWSNRVVDYWHLKFGISCGNL